jgi:hypothetical protein
VLGELATKQKGVGRGVRGLKQRHSNVLRLIGRRYVRNSSAVHLQLTVSGEERHKKMLPLLVYFLVAGVQQRALAVMRTNFANLEKHTQLVLSLGFITKTIRTNSNGPFQAVRLAILANPSTVTTKHLYQRLDNSLTQTKNNVSTNSTVMPPSEKCECFLTFVTNLNKR